MEPDTPHTRTMPPQAQPPGKRNRRRCGLLCWLRRGLTCIVLLVALLAGGFAWFLHKIESYNTESPQKADGIVVLTGGPQRIAEGAELLAKGLGQRMLITGVNTATTRSQIGIANPSVATQHCCIDLDYKALNTIGNAVETRRWVEVNGFRSLIVVTSTYHLPRTLLELGHALPEVTLIPFPAATDLETGNSGRSWPATKLLANEYVKYLVVWIRLKIASDSETSPIAKLLNEWRAESSSSQTALPPRSPQQCGKVHQPATTAQRDGCGEADIDG